MCLNPSVRAVLKNANNTLPLDVKSFHSLAVLGPFANSTTELMGGYSGPNLRILTHSPRDALQRRMAAVSPATQMLSATGCINGANRTNQIELAVHTAQQADATVLFVGDTHVAEFSDRTWNGLEYAQEQLVDAVSVQHRQAGGGGRGGWTFHRSDGRQACVRSNTLCLLALAVRRRRNRGRVAGSILASRTTADHILRLIRERAQQLQPGEYGTPPWERCHLSALSRDASLRVW
jgi:hypothetical protein